MLAVIIAILFFIIAAALCYDFVPDFLNWFGRIKIGQINDDGLWLKNVKKVTLKWLSRGTPKVRKNENNRLLLIKQIKDIKKSNATAYWQDAALLKSATKFCGDDVNESVSNLVDRYIDIFTGEWKENPLNVDAAILAYELMSNEFVDNKTIEPAMNYIAELVKEKYDEFGSIPYNSSIPNIKFVDTIGMVCPFLIKYAVEYKHPEYIDIAIAQIAAYRKYGFDDKTKLPFHCFDEKAETHLGICGWGRGCAWWTVGVMDSLKELLKFDGLNKEKALLLRLNIEILDELKKYVTEDGAVCRMLLNHSLPDSSASAMIAYCFASAYELTKRDEYRETAVRIMGYLKSVTRRDGVVDFSQGDTMGIGYYASGYSVIPAAQGFTLATAEILGL